MATTPNIIPIAMGTSSTSIHSPFNGASVTYPSTITTNTAAITGPLVHISSPNIKVGNSKIAVSEEVLPMKTIYEHPVFKAKASELVTAWLARFGSGWVNYEDIGDDEYFAFVAQRLQKLGKLEVHAASQPDTWQPKTMMRFIKDE